jgi:hypothetical protein
MFSKYSQAAGRDRQCLPPVSSFNVKRSVQSAQAGASHGATKSMPAYLSAGALRPAALRRLIKLAPRLHISLAVRSKLPSLQHMTTISPKPPVTPDFPYPGIIGRRSFTLFPVAGTGNRSPCCLIHGHPGSIELEVIQVDDLGIPT